MYCMNCGSELAAGAQVCEACGATVGDMAGAMRGTHAGALAGTHTNVSAGTHTDTRASASASRNANFPLRDGSYEYARTSVKTDMATVATDCYESLGFELTGAKEEAVTKTTTLSFRRSRRVRAKAQLTKLQRAIDDILTSITAMEAEKTRKARVMSITAGCLAALVLGVGMCLTMVWTQFMALGIVVGIVGIAGCIGAALLYRKTAAEETARINPQIEAAYDQLATACEEAQSVLLAQG